MSTIPVKSVVYKKVLNLEDIIRFQVMSYTFFNRIEVNSTDVDCLTFLGMSKERILKEFCTDMINKGISSSVQSSRNMITRLQDKHLIAKEAIIGTGAKKISLSPAINIQREGNIQVDVKCVRLEQ